MSTDMPASAPQYQGGPQQGAPQYQNAPQPQQIPPAPKKKGVVARILTAIIGIAVAGVVVYGINYFTSDAAQSKAGDCASVTGTSSKPEFKNVDCGSAEANYTIGKVLGSTAESCPGEYYDEYTETARRGPDSKLCLVPNLAEGKCYDLDGGTQMGYPAVDCGKSGVLKLTKLVKDSVDEAACGDATPLTYPEPKTTFCFAPAEEA
ncbi:MULTISPECIES: LppU/SCO3897 family protein [Saccharothrix]|uniref:LppU/SCO3897 family protein n=1 Tax=Saccharothrix TaxID=2071 RepID=UPI00093AA65A|nr:hypothetical protein [Saccharothrix sp. CB00851]OKI36134.1 hypothetical protein A6A25_22355 [Saccharothrix sp. CB00851]